MSAVRDLMTASPTTVEASASLQEIAQIMRDEDTGAVPVVDSDGAPIGIVTDRDIVIRCVSEGGDLSSATAAEAKSDDLVTIEPVADASEAARTFRERAVRRALVVEDGALAGIISIGDLAESLDPDSALADISGSPADE